ncbi:hypothetical protein VB712_14635 [Spirulina sp. CCNP1310]|uniref:hypothetical protein n=1 Tax=Spirulina sp. CCNP1310 TaxID=3110249 RepID=UPI002B1FD08B|nr:hypothetical protein [Spirulina sp. CCNP1310]MEA5420466.1 hypothetical protein [Spirulina sp. CCNP1310]
MNKMQADQKRFLENVQSVFEELDHQTLLSHPSDNPELDLLAIRFENIGEEKLFLDLNLNFIPLDEMSIFELLQFFMIVSEDIPPEAATELSLLIDMLNEKIPIGAFIYQRDRALCYFKYNYIIPANFDEMPGLYLRMVNQCCNLLVGILNNFVDGLIAVSRQEKTAIAAARSGAMAQFF